MMLERSFLSQFIFIIIVLVIQLTHAAATTTYIQSDLSQYGILEFASFTTTMFTQTVDETATLSNTFSPIFPSPPQILIGILYFDLGTVNLRAAFNYSVGSVSTTQVSIKFNKYGETFMYGTKVQYFAIYDNNIKIYTLTLNFQSTNDITTQNNKQYSFQLSQISGKIRNVQCLFTGFDSTYTSPPQDDPTPHGQLSIQTTVDSSNTYFTITTAATDLATNLKIVYLNCIEYYSSQANDYSMITDVQQKTTPQTQGQVDYAIKFLNASFNGNSISYFLGMTQMYLSQTGGAIRIEYINPSFSNSANTFSFSVKTWSYSTLYSATALFFNHQMIDCKSSSNQVNVSDQNQCQASCPSNYYSLSFQTTTICRPCDSSCSTCQNLNSCTTCPSNSYLPSSTPFCIQCDSNCLTCNNSSTQCTSCQPGYYLFNSICYNSKPEGTYCDSQLQCTQCSGLCNDCDSTLLNCNSCLSPSQYLLNQRCTINQPLNSYCPTPSTCQQCTNTNCLQCDSDLSSCTLCQTNWYIYEKDKNCYQNQPPGSYCQNLDCIACLSSCNTCSVNLYTCLSCPSNQFLLNGVCVTSKPQSTYCDPNNNCSSCSNSQCNTCDSTLNYCIQCNTGYFTYNGSCYSNCANLNQYFLNGSCTITQPPNTYCNPQKICQQCPSSCNGCNQILQCTLCADPTQFWYQGVCSTTQPNDTYCQQNTTTGVQNYCQNCHTSCSQCVGPLYSQCSACQSGFSLVGTSCVCSGSTMGYDQTQQQCLQCQINGCSDCTADYTKCSVCGKGLSLDKTSGKCYCSNLNTYYSADQQICIENTIQYCQVSSQFSNTCDQCNGGYYNYNNQMCSYCGRSKYTNSQNQCVNNCMDNCIICTNVNTCLLKFEDIANGQNSNQIDGSNNNEICNFSCGLCNGNSNSSCLTCSSSTRIYDLQNQTCKCQDGYTEVGLKDCESPMDIGQSYSSIQNIVFIIFMIAQMPFVPFNKFDKINIGFGVIQLISLISYDQALVSVLNYTQILKMFQGMSIIPLIKLEFLSESTATLKLFINQILLFSVIQLGALLAYFTQNILQSSKLIYLNKQILFFINRITSTYNIALLFYIIKLDFKNLNLGSLVILISSSVIQVLLSLLVVKRMHIEYKSFSAFREKAQTSSSMGLTTPILGGNRFDSQKNSNTIVVYELLFEVRRYLNGGILAFLNQSSISYLIISCIFLLSIFSIFYLKPLDNIKSNLEIMLIELLTSVCFILHSLYIKNNNTSSDKYYLLCSFISMIILQAIVIVGSLHQISLTAYHKFKTISSNGQKSLNTSVELVPQVLQKDQIDNILNSRRWDFDLFQGKNQRNKMAISTSLPEIIKEQ